MGKDSKKLKWRTLTGPEKLLVFRNIKIVGLLGDSDEARVIQTLWDDLLVMNKSLSARPHEITNDSLEQFETNAKAFVDKFISIYPRRHVTPYMHCMMHHVREFMSLYGSLIQFTQQGLEKYNDIATIKTTFVQLATVVLIA